MNAHRTTLSGVISDTLLALSGPQLVIGTPGRLVDFMTEAASPTQPKPALKVEGTQVFVLDEAVTTQTISTTTRFPGRFPREIACVRRIACSTWASATPSQRY